MPCRVGAAWSGRWGGGVGGGQCSGGVGGGISAGTTSIWYIMECEAALDARLKHTSQKLIYVFYKKTPYVSSLTSSSRAEFDSAC